MGTNSLQRPHMGGRENCHIFGSGIDPHDQIGTSSPGSTVCTISRKVDGSLHGIYALHLL